MTDAVVEKLIEASEALGNYSNIEDITDCLWFEDGGEVYYNIENNEEDLANSDGATYSFDIHGTSAEIETEGFLIFRDAHICTGDRVTFVVSKCNKFDVDKFWRGWEGEMDYWASPASEEGDDE